MTVLGFNTIWLKLVLLNSSVSESDSDFISEGCMMYSTLEMYAILVLGA